MDENKNRPSPTNALDDLESFGRGDPAAFRSLICVTKRLEPRFLPDSPELHALSRMIGAILWPLRAPIGSSSSGEIVQAVAHRALARQFGVGQKGNIRTSLYAEAIARSLPGYFARLASLNDSAPGAPATPAAQAARREAYAIFRRETAGAFHFFRENWRLYLSSHFLEEASLRAYLRTIERMNPRPAPLFHLLHQIEFHCGKRSGARDRAQYESLARQIRECRSMREFIESALDEAA